MKRLCFGSLFKLMAMAKGSGITEFSLCESLLAAAGTPQYGYSKEKASRLKSCKENVPIYTINDVRSTGIEKIEKYFEDHIVCLINANKPFNFCLIPFNYSLYFLIKGGVYLLIIPVIKG